MNQVFYVQRDMLRRLVAVRDAFWFWNPRRRRWTQRRGVRLAAFVSESNKVAAREPFEGVPMRMPYVVPEIKSIDVSKLEPLPCTPASSKP